MITAILKLRELTTTNGLVSNRRVGYQAMNQLAVQHRDHDLN